MSEPINPVKKRTKRKKKVIPPRTKMPEQDALERSKNFEEVNSGYSIEQALIEADRCLQCPKPKCVEGCPVNIDIPGFIQLIKEKRFIDANHKIKETNALPAVCGRVCPQENQCEDICVLTKKFGSVCIGHLERFVADYERINSTACYMCEKLPPNGKKIAIVGSGPAGLTVAGDLIKLGFDVTIFEAFHKGGGVLIYGIPEFRLPKSIVQSEIEELVENGVKIKYNMVIGKILTIEELTNDFDSVFIGVGAGVPTMLKIPGIDLNGVFSANEFLTRVNLMTAYKFPEYGTPIGMGKIVAVFGGGNVAMDSARTALRLGAEKVIVYYRRSEKELPARIEEYHHAVEEGIEFHFLTTPTRFIGEDYNLNSLELLKCELGEPDASGRRRPVPISCSEFIEKIDTAIIAIGTKSNPIITKATKGLELNKWGYIVVDENKMTSIPGVFAGGDIVTGAATVISAMGAGRRAVKGIVSYLKEKDNK